MDNMSIYNAVAEVPKEAQKPITGGRLKGMTDINPMWRIQQLTEQFGAVGIGWYYEILNRWTEDGASGEKCAFLEIALYIKNGDEWSKPIIGTGGSKYIANERNGVYTSDEVYKMALTDAISVACKALGMGANVYWAAGRSKYNNAPPENDITDETYNNPITAQQKSNIEAVFAAQPDGGKVLKGILFPGKELDGLTVKEYAEGMVKVNEMRNEGEKNIKRYVKSYAKTKGIKDGNAVAKEIETSLGIKLLENPYNWQNICNRIQELAQK